MKTMSIILEDGQEYNIERVLKEGKCPCNANELLVWYSDDNGHEAKCDNCDRVFVMYTSMATMNISNEPINKEEMTGGDQNEYYRDV